MAHKFDPLDKCDAIALEWLRGQDMYGKKPGDFAAEFMKARKQVEDELMKDTRKAANNWHKPTADAQS